MTSSRPGAGGEPVHVVHLPGRILISGESEQGCTLESVRGRQATFRTTDRGSEGSGGIAVAYVGLVGRLEGPAVRVKSDRVSLTIAAPEAKWARLRQQLALIAAMPIDEREELRHHRRIVPEDAEVRLTLPDGSTHPAKLRDLSRSGAAVEATAAVSIGDRVILGGTRGTVARLFEDGFAVQFARLLPLESFGPGVSL